MTDLHIAEYLLVGQMKIFCCLFQHVRHDDGRLQLCDDLSAAPKREHLNDSINIVSNIQGRGSWNRLPILELLLLCEV